MAFPKGKGGIATPLLFSQSIPVRHDPFRPQSAGTGRSIAPARSWPPAGTFLDPRIAAHVRDR